MCLFEHNILMKHALASFKANIADKDGSWGKKQQLLFHGWLSQTLSHTVVTLLGNNTCFTDNLVWWSWNTRPQYSGSLVHYNDVIMSALASQITSLTIVYSTVYSGANQRKHQSFASLDFVRVIHRRPADSPHKGSVTRIFFPFVDVTIVFSSGIGTCSIPNEKNIQSSLQY